ncbi:hypothetical protein COZ45_00980 [Candidatus Uhrbacteria bacterium CG_4_10_14_3_um_filter_41_21]|nr:MAG: hypothetical protein COZ45_00980 [Candidatus Uhrbacteria bacterium CG_4_10_14_3_um_filter_41_21]
MFNRKIKVISPKRFDKVGANFLIEIQVSDELRNQIMNDEKIVHYQLIDAFGCEFMGGSLRNFLISSLDENKLYTQFNFSYTNIPFIKNSYGRVALKLELGFNESRVFIPVILPQFVQELVPKQILRQHSRIESVIKRLERRLRVYEKKTAKIDRKKEKIVGDPVTKEPGHTHVSWEFGSEMFDLVDSLDCEEDNKFAKLIGKQERLDEKYQDAIEWMGPRLGGRVGQLDGFDFIVYSNDHDRHFHAIHRGKGLNACFSFPDIELTHCKNKNQIRSKDVKKILSYFKNQKNFNRLEEEFERRD